MHLQRQALSVDQRILSIPDHVGGATMAESLLDFSFDKRAESITPDRTEGWRNDPDISITSVPTGEWLTRTAFARNPFACHRLVLTYQPVAPSFFCI
jgi:hypothetical protein